MIAIAETLLEDDEKEEIEGYHVLQPAEKGKVEEDPEKIREIYKTFYQKLLKDREPEDEEEQEMQDLKEKCIEVMMKKGESKEIKEITGEEYELMKRKLKKKKAPDE